MKNKVLKRAIAFLFAIMLAAAPSKMTTVQARSTSDIADKALRKLGCRYVFASCHSMSSISNPNQQTFDCSGLVSWACYHAGYNIGSNTTRTLIHKGTGISYSNMQRGDIIIFAHSAGGRTPAHTGIYLGGGKMVHAPYTGARVRVEVISSSRRARFISARRLSASDVASTKTTTTTTTTTTNRTNTSVKAAAKLTSGTYKITSAAPARKSADSSASKLGTIKKGTEVAVKTIKNDKWAKVSFNGETAYFSLSNAKKTSNSTSSASNKITFGSGSLKYPAGTYKATNKLPVHASASAGSKVLGNIKVGTILKVSKIKNGKWSEVTYNGKTAYYSMKLTKKWAKSAKAKDTFSTKKAKKVAKADADYAKGTYKAVNAMPVRTAAKKSSKQLGTLKKGTLVAAKAIKNDSWTKISYNGKTAYVSLKNAKKYSASTEKGKTSFKKAKEAAEEKETSKTYKTGTYKLTKRMTLRDKASKDGKYLAELKEGTKVKVKAVKNKKWAKVTYKGKTGYVSLKYAKKA